MPNIPTYVARQRTDAGTGSMPRYSGGGGAAEGAAMLGRATENLGNAIQNLGATLLAKDQQDETFRQSVRLKEHGLASDQGIETSLAGMEPGGFGWKERVLKEQDERDAAFLKDTPDHLKPAAEQQLKLMRLNVEGKVDGLVTKARETWKTGEVARTTDRLGESVRANPDSYAAVRDTNAGLIEMAGFDPATRDRLVAEGGLKLIRAAVDGYIEQGRYDDARALAASAAAGRSAAKEAAPAGMAGIGGEATGSVKNAASGRKGAPAGGSTGPVAKAPTEQEPPGDPLELRASNAQKNAPSGDMPARPPGQGLRPDYDPHLQLPDQVETQIARHEARVRTENATERAAVTALIDEDLASRKATGEGAGGLTVERVAAALGPESAATWQRRSDAAMRFHAVTERMSLMPDAEIEARLATLRPEPGADAPERQEIYQDVLRQAAEIRSLRAADPAQSVETAPAVMEALKGANLAKPETLRPLARARLAAQEAAGIPREARSPMTNKEALTFWAGLRTAPQSQELDALRTLARQLETAFGSHAEAALRQVLAAGEVEEAHRAAAGIILRKSRGPTAQGTDPVQTSVPAERQSITTENGTPFTLDLRAREPVLRSRVPDPFRGQM